MDATHWSTRSMTTATGMPQSAISQMWRAFELKPHPTGSYAGERVERFVFSKSKRAGSRSGGAHSRNCSRPGWLGSISAPSRPTRPQGAAAILRRASTPSGQTYRVLDSGLRRADRVHQNRVLPPIPEVVVPAHLRPHRGQQIAQPEPVLVDIVTAPLGIGYPYQVPSRQQTRGNGRPVNPSPLRKEWEPTPRESNLTPPRSAATPAASQTVG